MVVAEEARHASSSGICQASMIVPLITPSSAGGISMTTGPTFFVLMKGLR
jgi:hypothetical protein